MNREFEHNADPTRRVEIDRKRAAQAYDSWCNLRGRAERGSKVHSPRLFYDAVVHSLDLTREHLPRSLKLPTTRSSWSNWRLGVGKPTTRIRFDVCWAVWMLTGVDITSNGFLQQLPTNATEMVKLGKARIVPSEEEAGFFELSIDQLHITMSTAKDVWLSDAKTNPAPHDKDIRIGAVRYGIREASIAVLSSDASHPLLTHLSPGESNKHGEANGAVLFIDPEEVDRWRIQPPISDDIIQARFERLRLIKNDMPTNSAKVSVSVSESDVYPKISLEESSPHVKKLENKERELARERLIEQLLRHRLVDNGVRRRYVFSHCKATFQ